MINNKILLSGEINNIIINNRYITLGQLVRSIHLMKIVI